MYSTDETDRLETFAPRVASYLATFDFADLDRAYGGNFLAWFYDRMTDGNYKGEFENLADRSDFWISTDAYEIARDYAEYLIGEK